VTKTKLTSTTRAFNRQGAKAPRKLSLQYRASGVPKETLATAFFARFARNLSSIYDARSTK